MAAFLELSKLLTAESSLDARLVDQYRDRLWGAYRKDLEDLEAAFGAMPSTGDPAADVLKLVNGETRFARLARQIVLLWYTAQFTGPDNKPDPPRTDEQYISGLLWRVIKAHPPGYSKGPYDYWATAP